MSLYFDGFNYSLANEDTSVELDLAEGCTSVLAICGSGARVIPHLQRNVHSVTAVDLAPAQLTYLQLKRELIAQLGNFEYLRFLGYHQAPPEWRRARIRDLRLSDEAHALASWEHGLARGLIYTGRWESKLMQISRTIRTLMRVDFSALFAAQTLAEQREIFADLWPRRRLKALLPLLASRSTLNRRLYRGEMPEDRAQPLATFLLQNFNRFFNTRLARTSFFHQMLFLGEVRYAEGFPLETRCLDTFREFESRLTFQTGEILDVLQRDRSEFLSLSDVASYLPPPALRALESALPHSSLQKAVVRTFRRHPQLQAQGFTHRQISSAQDLTGLYEIQLLTRPPTTEKNYEGFETLAPRALSPD